MSSGLWKPLTPDALHSALADWLAASPGPLRVAIDGPPGAHPADRAVALVEPLRGLGRRVDVIEAASFWRDASVRLEHGHQDVEAFGMWLDADALRREVLVAVTERGEYLPSLRDPATNRSTRVSRRPAGPATVLIVAGPFLQGLGLPFDRVVHLAMSPAARARHTPADDAWTLPAFDAYDDEVHPGELADVTVRLEDPRRPAVHGL